MFPSLVFPNPSLDLSTSNPNLSLNAFWIVNSFSKTIFLSKSPLACSSVATVPIVFIVCWCFYLFIFLNYALGVIKTISRLLLHNFNDHNNKNRGPVANCRRSSMSESQREDLERKRCGGSAARPPKRVSGSRERLSAQNRSARGHGRAGQGIGNRRFGAQEVNNAVQMSLTGSSGPRAGHARPAIIYLC